MPYHKNERYFFMSKKGYVTAGHEHFKKSKLEYRNWMQALFREGFQNSIDAGAKKLYIEYKEHSFNEIEISIKDNGTGMNLDTLLNVLLKMGGSKKDGENQIGGFGYAKSILFFAHNEYNIKTQNYQVNGIGGEYTYKETNDYINGTHFSIIVEKDYYHSNLENIEQYICELLEYSDLNHIGFIINNKINKIKSKDFSFDLISELGDVKFKDSGIGNTSTLWIRVNGLTMFKHETYQSEKSSTFEGILDINKSPLEMLTANRDGLQYQYANKLNTLFQKLSKERDKFTYNGMFNFILNENSETIIKEKNIENQYNETINKLKENLTKNSDSLLNKSDADKDVFINKVFKDLSSEKDKFNDFFEESIKKINQKYYPVNFTVSTEKSNSQNITIYKKFFKELLKQKNIRIAIIWNIVTNHILKTSFFKNSITFNNHNIYFEGEKLYKGFLFGEEETLGCNSWDSKEGHYLSINPSSQYVTNDFTTILDIAIHECTHFFISNHNENFCFNEFLLRRKIQKGLKIINIKNEIKESFKEFQNKLSFS
jgi:hypothetical protein